MEQPYAGRSTITEGHQEIEVIIPSRSSTLFLITTTPLLLLLIGVLVFLYQFSSSDKLNGTESDKSMIDIYLSFAILAIVFVFILHFRIALWSIAGKEIIHIRNGQLNIRWTGSVLYYNKTYDLKEIKNFTINEENQYNIFLGGGGIRGFGYSRGRVKYPSKRTGIISFDYGLRSVNFGQSIEGAEARYIVSKLTPYLTKKNSTF